MYMLYQDEQCTVREQIVSQLYELHESLNMVQCNSISYAHHLVPLYEYFFDSASICNANSRVGVKISTVGPPLSLRGLNKNTCM